MKQFMLDTNAFNAALDANIEPLRLSRCGELYITHVQLNEIQATKQSERLTKLAAVFNAVDQYTVPTVAAIWDVYECGNAEWDDANGDYDRILLLLNQKNENSRGNIRDALIGVTALKRRYTLVTNDPSLLTAVVEMGGYAITLREFLTNAD